MLLPGPATGLETLLPGLATLLPGSATLLPGSAMLLPGPSGALKRCCKALHATLLPGLATLLLVQRGMDSTTNYGPTLW